LHRLGEEFRAAVGLDALNGEAALFNKIGRNGCLFACRCDQKIASKQQ